jgi:DNA-directed RNA polymerase subunit L
MDAMNNLKSTFESGLQELRTLRDEIRVKLHLVGQEARDQWEKHLEPHVGRIEQQIKESSEDTREALKEALERARAAFREFRARMTKDGKEALDSGDEPPTNLAS